MLLYQKVYTNKRWVDAENRPKAEVVIEKYWMDNFTEYFVHRLSDHLPTIKMHKQGDGLDRLQAFRDLYVECMLDSQREYVKDCYTPP